MKKPLFGPMIAAFLLFVLLLSIPTSFLNSFISKKTVDTAAISLDPSMFQGVVLQQKMLDSNKYVPIYGSSELLRVDPFHPSFYFRSHKEGFTPFLIGRGGTQSIIQFLGMAAQQDHLKGKKIVFVLSPQWFDPQGLGENHFAANFSTLQAYKFVFNNKIDSELKRKVAKRLLSFETVKGDDILKNLLEGIIYTDQVHKTKAKLAEPIAFAFMNILEKKDFVDSLVVKPYKRSLKVKEISDKVPMDELRKKAEKYGEVRSTNNSFRIENKYFNKYMAWRIDELKDFRKKESYDVSKEYDDLQIVLDYLKQEKVQALFISVPVNGPWYDYAGFSKEKRNRYYKKIRNQVEAAGFPVADLSEHEYDPYFLKDSIHIGWKGWTYVDEAISDFMKNPQPKKAKSAS